MIESTTRFHVLCVLASGPGYPYRIARDIAAATDGRVLLEAGNLHRRLQQLLAEGLIADCPRPADAEDSRRRYYVMTPKGRATLRDEADRLHAAVRTARAALAADAKR